MYVKNHRLKKIIMLGVFAALVIFQPEVRRGIQHLGVRKFFQSTKTHLIGDKTILALDKAILYMSKRNTGALITVERNVNLDEYIETGINLNGDITEELLINIFIPNTPLHDGAVIIRNDKIVVANAYLPLSENNRAIPKELGTRHRAAVGISELSDAVTIVISEETGSVSLTFDSRLYSDLTQEQYLSMLRRELLTTSYGSSQQKT